MRTKLELYPDFTAEIEYINKKGVDTYIISKIIEKHLPNSIYNKKLYDRYTCVKEGVPIFGRHPRFEDTDAINNRINNDFFSEIVDFKTGYFAGVPIAYSYSNTQDAKDEIGESLRDEAHKAISDFITRNNMYDVDMETTKYASICGYSGRLLYLDNGIERVMPIAPYEAAILSNTDISEPKYAVRYYTTTAIDGTVYYKVAFYGPDSIKHYEGTSCYGLTELVDKEERNMYDTCTLQGIANNKELVGDAEKVLELIDTYDRNISDASNDLESFSNAYMVIENLMLDDNDIERAQANGILQVNTGAYNGKVYFLTKDMSDTYMSNQLARIEKNIYRFSKTPNLSDEAFGTASGVALKFKLTGLEAKCGMFQAKMVSAGVYMFKALANSLAKKTIKIEPLQVIMDFSRNFPLDLLSEAQAVGQLISTGVVSKRTAISQLSFVDDPDYELDLIEEEKNDIPSLIDKVKEDDEENNAGAEE
jgi:SPP1 family phage portal protein